MNKTLLTTALLAFITSANAQLYSNGPVVDSTGKSVLTAPATTFGNGDQAVLGNAVADDFTVTGAGWNVSGFDFFSYQTGATAFTFTSATWSVVSGDVNSGSVVASGTTTVTNGGLLGYRVQNTDLANTARTIYDLSADVTDFSLAAGHYWLVWSLTGSAALSGPWVPPTSDARTGNAQQFTATTDSFQTIVDAGSLLTMELPFKVNGTTITPAVPEPSSYALMLLGGLAVAGIARRRRSAR